MPIFSNTSTTIALFMFNHIIDRFGVPKMIMNGQGSHFDNTMMEELVEKLGFHHKQSTPYYPQSNGKVEAINCIFKTMIEWMVGNEK